MTWEFAVQVSAQIQTSPPTILLSWPQDQAAVPEFYQVWRKNPATNDWGAPIQLPGDSTNYVDTNIVVGVPYEYQVYKQTSNHVGYGYIYAGIELPLIEERGTVILLVEKAFANDLASELLRLQQDLVGDGWQVVRHDIASDANVTDVKSIVVGDYESDPQKTRAVFIIGHIPVPYSGAFSADGHPEQHTGAWPADVYYADMYGTWTDSIITSTNADDSRNFNVPGDGKFDQSEIPGAADLEVGRVDFYRMPGVDTNGVATFPSELELLRRYLNKDHNFRTKALTVSYRGLVFNETGDRNGEAFAANAWRNYAPLLGPPQAPSLHYYEFIPILRTNSYLWAYATGGSTYSEMSGLGGTGSWNEGGLSFEFVQNDLQTIFTMMFGSWLGDWDSYDNLMRAVLAMPTYGLTAAYVGRPHWYFHHMAGGETIGYSLRLTQNNRGAKPLYLNQSNAYPGFVHIALMGDPTLRLHPMAPVGNLKCAPEDAGLHLTWDSSPEQIVGYHIYRALDPQGPFTRLTKIPAPETEYVDPEGLQEAYTYMVRAVKLQHTPSGSYYNASQGVFQTYIPPLTVKLQVAGAKLIFKWPSIPGRGYRLMFKESLADTNWMKLTAEIVASSTTTFLTNDVPDGAGQKFYSVMLVQQNEPGPEMPPQGGTEYPLPDPHTIALYRFNDPSDAFKDSANDYYLSRQGFVQLGQNTTWMRTPAGYTARFTALDDQLQAVIPDGALRPPNSGTEFSLEAWVYFEGYPYNGTPLYLLHLAQPHEGDSFNREWSIYMDTALAPLPQIFGPGGQVLLPAFSPDQKDWSHMLPLREWHLLKFTVDQSGTTSLYIDEQLASATNSVAQYTTDDWVLTFGHFVGEVDEVRLSDIVR